MDDMSFNPLLKLYRTRRGIALLGSLINQIDNIIACIDSVDVGSDEMKKICIPAIIDIFQEYLKAIESDQE